MTITTQAPTPAPEATFSTPGLQNATMQMAAPEVQPMAANVAPLQIATPAPDPIPEATFATPDNHHRQYLDMPTPTQAIITAASQQKKTTTAALSGVSSAAQSPAITPTAKDPIIGTWTLNGYSDQGSATIQENEQGTLTIGTPPCDYMDVPFTWKSLGSSRYQITLSDSNGKSADAVLDPQGHLIFQIPILPDGAYFVKGG